MMTYKARCALIDGMWTMGVHYQKKAWAKFNASSDARRLQKRLSSKTPQYIWDALRKADRDNYKDYRALDKAAEVAFEKADRVAAMPYRDQKGVFRGYLPNLKVTSYDEEEAAAMYEEYLAKKKADYAASGIKLPY